MKLPTRITMKASQNKFQSKVMIESTFNTPTKARVGKATPSILQWTLPQDRPFRKQPTPTQATATTQVILGQSGTAPSRRTQSRRLLQGQRATPTANSTKEVSRGLSCEGVLNAPLEAA